METQSLEEAKKTIEHIEAEVKQWMEDTFNSSIGVSVQTLYSFQGNEREKPRNPICVSGYDDSDTLMLCDMSDQIMKLLSRDHKAMIAYQCHKGLSNIVIPHYDGKITRTMWYIFLGQFFINNVSKCSGCNSKRLHCTANQRLLRDDEINLLNSRDIDLIIDRYNVDYVNSIRAIFFSNGRFQGSPKLKFTIDTPQLLLCVKRAKTVFSNTFKEIHSASTSDQLKAYVKQFNKLPSHFPKIKDPNSTPEIPPSHPLRDTEET